MKEDKYIWADFKDNLEYALPYIYNQNVDFLFFYGKKFSTDEELILDTIQELFYDLIKYRKNLAETDNIRFYLIKSFRRKLLRGIRNKQKIEKINTDSDQLPEIVFSVEEDLITDEEQYIKIKAIRQGLSTLNARQRELFYYKFTLGYDYTQITGIMSISYDSARQLVSRGINSLKQYLAKNNFTFWFICLKRKIQ